MTRLPDYPITRYCVSDGASEEQLQTQLNVPLTRLTGNPSKRSVGRIRLRVAPVRQVWEVEELRPELRARARRRPKALEQRDVPVLRVRTANRIATRVAERPRGRPRERRRVEPEILIERRSVGERRIRDRGIADQIPRLVRRVAHARAIVVKPDRQRLTGLEDRRAGHLPATQQLLFQIAALAPERELV